MDKNCVLAMFALLFIGTGEAVANPCVAKSQEVLIGNFWRYVTDIQRKEFYMFG